MRHSTDRILTTHVGSLPRPHKLLDVLKQRLEGEEVDAKVFADLLRGSVEEMVHKQVEAGIDIVTDGEMSKPGHAVYINQRMEGFEPRPDLKENWFSEEIKAFPEYYEDYFERAMLGGAIARSAPIYCVGPIRYAGHEVLQTDL